MAEVTNKGAERTARRERTEVAKGRRQSRFARPLAIIALLVTMIGCGVDIKVDSYVVDLPPTMWSRSTTLTIPNSDTTSLRDIYLFVRYQPISRTDTLEFMMRTTSPDHRSVAEAIKIPLDRLWQRRRNETKTIEMLHRTNILWDQSGDYEIFFSPMTPTPGIEAIGVKFR